MKHQHALRRNHARITVIAAALLLAALCASPAAAFPSQFLNPNAKDVDKLHDMGNWFRNYWDDVDYDGDWDPDEPVADAIDPTWINPIEGGDETCWVAAAATMLGAAGYDSGNADHIYWDILMNMGIPSAIGVGDPNNRYGVDKWIVGGWVYDALAWYLENRPNPFLESTITAYYSGNPAIDDLPWTWVENPFEVAAEALANGKQVDIDIYGPDIWHSVTLQGYDWNAKTILVTDSERDIYGDIEQYSFDLQDTSGWNVAYDGFGNVEVNALFILDTKAVPEPATFGLVGIGLTGVFVLVRKRTRQK